MRSAKRLLIVDDDDTYREVLARSLTRRGFTVDGAANPGAALEVFRAVRPDFVLLDLNLDGQSGLNFIAPLRVLSSDVRIVVLTGYASIQTAVSALRLGAVHYLPKPANVADIVKALLAGADVVQVVAELLTRGPGRLAELLAGLQQWMEQQEYESVEQMTGALSLRSCPDPEAYERGNYLRMLQLWRD
jgi:ActR/RegA family two-component response regulator